MRLIRLRVERAPGIDAPFDLDEGALDRPVVLVVGPNASGKTTLVRAVRALLWPDLAPAVARIEVGSLWRKDDETLEATLHPDGGTRWWRDGIECSSPPLPPAHLSPCFTLGALELLKPETDAQDAQLTGLIRRQLAGGYDLDQLLATRFQREARGGAREVREFREARGVLSEVRRKEDSLAEQEARLEELRASLEGARQAAAEAERLERRLELLDVRARLAERRRQLARDFPEGMERLKGSEGQQLEELESRRREIEEDVRQHRERIDRARRELEAAALGDQPPSETDLEVHRQLVQQAREHERRRRELELQEARAAGRRDRARRALGAEADAESAPEISGDDLERWEALATRIEEARARCTALAAEIDALTGDEPEEAAAAAREQAEHRLAEWLAEPRPDPLPWVLAGLTTVLGLGLAATWARLVDVVGPEAGWGAAVAALLLVLAGWSGVARRRWAARRRHRQLKFRLEELGGAPPAAWTVPSAARRLQEIRQQRAADARARDDAKRRRRLASRLERGERELEELRSEAADLQRSVGLRVEAGTARTAHVLRHLADWQQARSEIAALASERRAVQAELDGALDRVGRLIEAHGGEPPAEAEEASARLDELGARLARAAEAQRAVEESTRALEELAERRRRTDRAREQLFEQAGLPGGEAAELESRLAQLDAHRAAQDELRRLRDDEARLVASVGSEAERDDDPAALAAARDERRHHAARHDALLESIHKVETLVDQRRKGHQLQDALAAADAARDRLLDRRTELARKAAGRVLVRRAAARHQEEQQPVVLRAASSLLARFTGYRYELEIGGDPEGPQLRAREAATGRRLEPAQLSDGTRAQLLLALRLAFAQQVESGARLPLLLDEALVASDPLRFDAIADNLVQLAAETGRQVIFLTSDPHDAARWDALMRRRGLSPAAPVDLLALRRGQRAATCPLPALPPADDPVPSPEGHHAASYARALDVAAPDPWAGIDAWHPLHLWPGDLEGVRALVASGLDRIGRWRLFRRHRPGDPGPLDAARAARLDAAAVVGDAVLRGWRIGRGRPLDRETLAAADGVTERYVDELWDKARQLGRDAAALLEALRRREVRGFRQDKLEQLERELRESGHLDRRETLDREALLARARAALEAREAPRASFSELVEQVDVILSRLPGAVGPGSRPAGDGEAADG